MRILLLSPPSPQRYNPQKQYHPAPGLVLLGTILRRAGHQVAVHELGSFEFESALARIPELLERHRPELIGIGFLTCTRFGAYRAVWAIRSWSAEVPIVLGGRHATYLYAQLLRNLPVDAVIVGEAERSLPAFVDALAAGRPWHRLAGVASLRDGRVLSNPPPPPVENLDELPFPDYSLIEPRLEPIPADADPGSSVKTGMMIETSRGCPGHCQFCQSPDFFHGRERYRSPANVVDQIEWLYRDGGYGFFTLSDDTFGAHLAQAQGICDELIDRHLSVRWDCCTRADVALEPQFLAKMRRAGCYRVWLGVESASPTILRAMGKGIDVAEVVRCFDRIHAAGLEAAIMLIVGYRGETRETLDETLRLIERVRPDAFVVSIPAILPGSALHRRALSKGLIDDEQWMNPEPDLLYAEDLEVAQLHDLERWFNGQIEALRRSWGQELVPHPELAAEASFAAPELQRALAEWCERERPDGWSLTLGPVDEHGRLSISCRGDSGRFRIVLEPSSPHTRALAHAGRLSLYYREAPDELSDAAVTLTNAVAAFVRAFEG